MVGHEVIVTAHFPYANGAVADGVARWCWDVLRAMKEEGIDAHGVGYVGSTTENHKIVPLERLVESVLQENPRVCVIHTSCKGEDLLRACAEHDVKSIWVQPYWELTKEVRSLVNLATVTITPLPKYADNLRAGTEKTVECIPFPIDTAFWCPGSVTDGLPTGWDKDYLNIVYAGRMGGSKKIHRFISPYKEHLVNRLPRHKLWLVGPEEPGVIGLIREEVRRCGVEDTVVQIPKYVGTDEDLRNLYRAADVFIFPSVGENYAYTPLEVMSCATPLVTFGNTGAHFVPCMDYFPEYPYKVNPSRLDEATNFKNFCGSVLDVVANPDKARKTMLEYRQKLNSIMRADTVMPKMLCLLRRILCEEGEQKP